MENNENKGMTLKQFVENWEYLIKDKEQYKQYDFINMGLDCITVVCENGIVIKADDYGVDYLFGNEWITLYRKTIIYAQIKIIIICQIRNRNRIVLSINCII